MSTGFVFGDLRYLSHPISFLCIQLFTLIYLFFWGQIHLNLLKPSVHSISILLFYIEFTDELLKLIGLHKEFMYKLVVDLNQRNLLFTNLHLLESR